MIEDSMRTDEILAKALDLLEKRGWAKGILEDECGQLCALGAIHKALGAEDSITQQQNDMAASAYRVLANAIPEDFSKTQWGSEKHGAWSTMPLPRKIWHYNDFGARNFQEVRDWFRMATDSIRIGAQ